MQIDMNLIVKNVIQNKNGIMIGVNVKTQNQSNITYVKKIMLEILAYVIVSVTDCDMGEYLKDCACIKSLADDLVVTCNETVNTPDTTLINSNDKTIFG